MGSPYFARWAQYGLSVALFRPLGSIRAMAPAMCSLRCAHTPTQPPYFAIAPYGLSVALFRPLGSIRALAPAMCSLRCAHTPTQPPYFARWAQYGLLSSRGCATLTPGCILAPLQGALFPLAESTTPAPRASIPPRHLWRGGGRQAGGEVRKLYPCSLSTLSIAQSWAFFLS